MITRSTCYRKNLTREDGTIERFVGIAFSDGVAIEVPVGRGARRLLRSCAVERLGHPVRIRRGMNRVPILTSQV